MWVWECESILSKSRGVGSLDDLKRFDRSLDMNWHAELISIIFILHSHWRSISCACNAMLLALRSGHQSHFNLFVFLFFMKCFNCLDPWSTKGQPFLYIFCSLQQGLINLTERPSRALNIALNFASRTTELQRHSRVCHTRRGGPRASLYHLTQPLIVCYYHHSHEKLTVNKMELVIRLASCQYTLSVLQAIISFSCCCVMLWLVMGKFPN